MLLLCDVGEKEQSHAFMNHKPLVGIFTKGRRVLAKPVSADWAQLSRPSLSGAGGAYHEAMRHLQATKGQTK